MFACKETREIVEKEILPHLPVNIARLIRSVPSQHLNALTEIRLRTAKPLMLHLGLAEVFITPSGQVSKIPGQAYIVSAQDIFDTLSIMSQSSLYALEEELRNGYLTLHGGHRVGFVGQAVVDGGKLRTLKNISAFNIRIAREISGCAQTLLPYLITEYRPYNTLIISPPQCGKTTILRDITRQLSNGVPGLCSGYKVGVVDERSEIAGVYQGIPQKNVGIRTDVLDACPKAEGMIMLIRSMSPQVIIADEIGRSEDVTAIGEAVQAGVNLIVSVHGQDVEQIRKRPSLRQLLKMEIFERYVVLGRSQGVGTIERIYDGKFLSLPYQHPVCKEERSCG